MHNPNVVIAEGSSVYDSKIHQHKLTVDELFDKLQKPKIRAKKDGPYFIFASFKEDRRTASNVKFYYGATLDLDNSDINLREVRKVLKPLKSRYCIYTTHSHMDEGKGNRYRVVIPYAEPVSKEKHVEVTIYLNSLFGATGVDTSSKALSRPMYYPACPRSRRDHFVFYESRKQTLLNPEEQIEIPGHLKWEIEELTAPVTEKVDITSEFSEGGRNDHIARVTGTLIQQGKTLQEIIDFCDEINQLKFSPPMRTTEVARTVKSVWSSHTRNHDDKDWAYEQLLDRIEKTDCLGRDLGHLLSAMALSIRKEKTSPLEADLLLKAMKKKDPGLTISTLRAELKNKQKKDKTERKEASTTVDLDEDFDTPVIEKIRREYKDFFFVVSQNAIYQQKFEMFSKVEAFNTNHSHLKHDFNQTTLPPFRILDEINAIQKVDAVRFHPGKDVKYKDYNGMLCLNSFKRPDVKPIEGDVSPMLRHFRYLFPNEFERNVVLDFIAFNYQHPGEKIMWSPIIKGKKGIGKSVISNYILSAIFGHSNINSLNNSQPLLKEFNSWQTGSQIVVIQELYISNRLDVKQQVTENIKSFITDRFLSVRKMHTDAFQQENVTNLMAFTNHDDSLYITDDERRFCMIRCEVEPKSRRYYGRLIKYLESNIGQMAYYFKHRKINTISAYELPMTHYTIETIDSSRNWAEKLVSEELLDTKSLFNTNKAFTWEALCHIIHSKIYQKGSGVSRYEDIYNGTTSSGRILRQAIIELGFRTYERKGQTNCRFRISGAPEKIWVSPYGIKHKFHLAHEALVKKEAARCQSQAEVEFQQMLAQ